MTQHTVRAAFPLELRTISMDERTVEGLAVPWGEVSYLTPDPGGERFLPGAFTKSLRERSAALKLFLAHDHSHAVGRALKLDARHPDGLWSSWQFFRTPAGDAALAEAAEGALDMFSVGFRPVKSRRAADGVRDVQEAELHEVSIAPIGAYQGARVLAMRTPAEADGLTGDQVRSWLESNPMPAVTLTQPGAVRAYSI
jgi:HK97 family phage prohead protease